VQNILLAYRNIVNDSNSSYVQKERTVECAKALLEKISKNAHLTEEDQSE